MDNNKKKLTVVLVLLALVTVFAVLVFTGIINFDSKPTEELFFKNLQITLKKSLFYALFGQNFY